MSMKKILMIIVLFTSLNCYCQDSSRTYEVTKDEDRLFNGGDTINLGQLYIKWAGIIDNGEGDDCPHGPTSSLHVLIYPGTSDCPGNQKKYSGFYKETMLRGPESRDFCPLFFFFPKPDREWLDGQDMQMDLSIYNWKYFNEEVLLVIYEADPLFWKIPLREHDMLFCYKVSRQGTLNNSTVLGYVDRPAEDDAISNCINT